MDYYFKTSDEQELWTRLITAGIAEEVERNEIENDQLVTRTYKEPKRGQILDVVGEIWKPTGRTIQTKSLDNIDIEVPEMVNVGGFHANLRGALTPEQVDQLRDILLDPPLTPHRVWA